MSFDASGSLPDDRSGWTLSAGSATGMTSSPGSAGVGASSSTGGWACTASTGSTAGISASSGSPVSGGSGSTTSSFEDSAESVAVGALSSSDPHSPQKKSSAALAVPHLGQTRPEFMGLQSRTATAVYSRAVRAESPLGCSVDTLSACDSVSFSRATAGWLDAADTLAA